MFGPASLGVWGGPLVLAWSGSVSPVVTLFSSSLLEKVCAAAAGAAAATPCLRARLGLEGCSRLETVESGRALSRLFTPGWQRARECRPKILAAMDSFFNFLQTNLSFPEQQAFWVYI